MKKAIRTLTVLVMVILMLTVATIPAMAADFDFESAIENFTETSFNTKKLKVGETNSPLGASWLTNPDVQCYISDESVITFDNGVVTAVGKGTAYIAIVQNADEYKITCYKVSNKASNNMDDLVSANKDMLNAVLDDSIFSTVGSIVSGGFIATAVGFIFFAIFFVFVVTLMITSAKKSKELDSAMQAIAVNPCQNTAEAAVEAFSNMNAILRFMFANGRETSGVHFVMWREVFNNTVIPCSSIKFETKEALRQAMIRLNTHSLKPVFAIQTEEEAKEAAQAFGAAGEENVWHNLKTVPDCDVYRNVKIRNGDTCSEIDAILVSESMGIFLFETKSIGGVFDVDGNKVIRYDQLREDPSNQIYRHEYDFVKYFADIGIGKRIKNVLVFSWPHHDTRRWVDNNTFPKTDYDIITVEQLGGFFRMQSHVAITREQRNAIAAKLKSCSGECIVR